MKALLLVFFIFGSISSFACSCSKGPISTERAVKDLLRSVGINEITAIDQLKHHTTLQEKFAYKVIYGGSSSCSGKDDNGDISVACMMQCVDTVKVSLEDCSIKMKVTTKMKKAKASVINSTCSRIKKGKKISRKHARLDLL